MTRGVPADQERRRERARRGAAVVGIVAGLPLALVALDRAVRATLTLTLLLLGIVLLREGEGPAMHGRGMQPGERRGGGRAPDVDATARRRRALRRRAWVAVRTARAHAAESERRAALNKYISYAAARYHAAAAAWYRRRARRHLRRWLGLSARYLSLHPKST